MKEKKTGESEPITLHQKIKIKKEKFVMRPLKETLKDYLIYFVINIFMIYFLLFLTSDQMVAMICVLWVGIISWRNGPIYGGIYGTIVIYLSNFIAMTLYPGNNTTMSFYFDNKVPGAVIGIAQCLITGLVVGYISSLIHRLKIEIKLREKTQMELENKIAELDAFGHTVAHDLKNPLMVINMSIEALLREFKNYDNPKANKKLAFISDGTNHMISIIESILMLAGVKKIDPKEFGEFPVSESVNEALKRLEYNIETNDVKISKPDNWPSVYGYAPWITEVWVNYINNAIKYGGNKAQQIKPVIELGYDNMGNAKTQDNGYIRFWVKDNGEGIPKENTASLFREFTRLHTGDRNGHGLGLSIVKNVVEKFCGTVGVESDIGKGSLFYFTLPVTKTAVQKK